MNLAIIAAGESSRIKNEGLNKSKLMISIKGEYLIERIIRIARSNNIDKAYCIINSHEPELKNFLISTDFGIELKLLVKDTLSSMHSLFELAPYLMDSPFIVSTSDSVFVEGEFTGFIKYSENQKHTDGVLAVTSFIDDEKPLCLSMDSENVIRNFSDSIDGYKWATGGIYYFSPSIFKEMENTLNQSVSRLRNFLKYLVKKDYILKGYPFSKIVDIDHVSDIAIAEEFITQVS